MKLLYIVNKDEHKKKFIGVYKKIIGQKSTLEAHGCLVDFPPDFIWKEKRIEKIFALLPFMGTVARWSRLELDEKTDAIYLRYNFFDKQLLEFFKKVKLQNPKLKILMEIPTYPFAAERTCWKQFLFVKRDYYYRNKITKYIDKIVTYSDDDMIWGVHTLKIINGIETNKVVPRKINCGLDCINLIEVSTLASWHGYDRLIEGIGEYYKNGGTRKIKFHMAGDGAVISQYKEIVAKYEIEENVVFYGNIVGSSLDELYDKAQIAVESLGNFRKNLYLSSSLKTREYLSKGLPIIGAGVVDVIPSDFPYYLNVQENNSPIDITKVIEYYDGLYPTTESFFEVNEKIRAFATKHCDFNSTMKPIFDYLGL